MGYENADKQKENCPLCVSTKEAMNRLRPDDDSEIKSQQSSRKIKTVFWCLATIIGLAGVHKILSKAPLAKSVTENNPLQGQSISVSEENKEIGSQINALAPDFVSEDISGNKITLSSFRGKKPVFLVFWATWCGYCAKEKEDLKTFTRKYQDKIKVLAVVSGESKETIGDYIQDEGINFLMLVDEQRTIWNQYLIRGTPSHFLIDKEGGVITLRPGLASLADMETMFSMISVE